jgi:hypothetical protein
MLSSLKRTKFSTCSGSYSTIHVSQHLKMDEDELSTEMLIHRLSEERQRSTEFHLNSQSPCATSEKSAHGTPLIGSPHPAPQTQALPQDQVQLANGDTSQRSLRKRKSNGHHGNALDPVEEAMRSLTDEERRNWKGWVELESDPVCIPQTYNISSHVLFLLISQTDSSLTVGSIQLHLKRMWCQGCKDRRNIQPR